MSSWLSHIDDMRLTFELLSDTQLKNLIDHYNHDLKNKQSILFYIPNLKILVICLVKSTVSQINYPWQKCF